MRCNIELFVVWFSVFFTSINGQIRTCKTPNGESARCIPIRSCPGLYDAVTTQDQRQLEFLKKSQCGFRGSPYVCCGTYDNYRDSDESASFEDDSFSWGSNNRRQPSWNNDEPSWGNTNVNTGWGSSNNNRGPNNNNGGWGGNRRPSFGGWNGDNEDRSSSSNNNRGSTNNNRGSSTNNRGSSTNNRGTSQLPNRSSCGFQDGDRILDGQATGLTEFPWMALLRYRKRNGNMAFSCGGTLISSRYVLTAAHCVRGQILTKIGPLVNVRLGEYNTDTDQDCNNRLGFQICNEKPLDAEIEQVIVHPDYSDTSSDRYNDIALIKLSRDVPTSDFIKPICLPTQSENPRVGDRLVVAGWGRTEFASSSPVKLKLWVPVAEKSQCSARFRSAGVNLGSKQLCAGGERGRDSCNGDSGGPLMATTKNDAAQWYLEGIVSFGAKCGSEGWPGIYTKVSEYLDWIRSNAV